MSLRTGETPKTGFTRTAAIGAMAATAMLAVLTTVVLIGTSTMAVSADARFTKAQSDAFQRKMLTIVQAAGHPTTAATTTRGGNGGNPLRQTPILENELNSYLRYELRSQVPAGVAEPTITIVGDGRLAATAIVDLDAVREAKQSTSWFDPVRLLSGRVPVTASGVLQTQQGTGRFLLESAEISGIPVPKTVLQQVVGYYTRNAQNPSGVNLDDAFELPARIREIRVQPGQAIVIQ